MKRAVAVFVAAIAAVALLPSAAHAKPNDPPRAQFWVHAGFGGDKLDKDAPGSEGNLAQLGRGCYVIACPSDWNDQISTLWTTGGGQPPSWLEIFEDINFSGHCVLIP